MIDQQTRYEALLILAGAQMQPEPAHAAAIVELSQEEPSRWTPNK